ncbi:MULTISPECIES: VOC family protein [Paenibacillus]|uniref:Catechol 2,3-dioxygenase-like lactoylglutathione lyase family enzyme n=1 Tax=Paenibacillus pabuli TaxID=1472 RepID=A0A855XQ92_9BACL|nr:MULTISPECIES: VOC family protein [Paenibacillus]PWW36757.1 catechol 2,3-dioxygenase-like lactoylglutathione lyase family enzyme [Paenibacillus pabuli]PXW04136.1 catechol 2,3-dioxygenase-like lactoylglutathione lyase family enzyme [Paenibacillus taichungensis]
MSPILNQISTVFIPVRDIEKAREWYCDILGLPVDGEILFGHLYIIPMNGTRIVLDSKIYSEDHTFKTPAFHFDTLNIEEAYAFMHSKNVNIRTSIEHEQWFNFQDPDGNWLMVCKC